MVEMGVDDSRKYGLMRENEGASKWKITNSRIKLIITP